MLVCFVWLLFYPNTLYIATDIFWLVPKHGIPFWFDALMVFAYIGSGLLLGFISLYIVEGTLKKYLKWRRAHLIALAVLVISSFGVYIGRFLRWYSWDILFHPLAMVHDIGGRLFYTGPEPLMVMFTIGASIFFILLYEIFLTITKYVQKK